MTSGNLVAIIRLKGSVGVRHSFRTTLNQLHLTRANHCVVVKASPSLKGMLQEAKDYITWGEVSEDVVKRLEAKYGKGPVYRLHPAKGGLESLKRTFPKGSMGNRGPKIVELIERMSA